MNGRLSHDEPERGQVALRFWASARAAAGLAETHVTVEGPVTLAFLVETAGAGNDRLARILGTCSVLLADQPVASQDPASVLVAPGQTVEFLPPFAGG
ncbi:MAG: MoaD/ThiS family protein [Nocardioidaceae bacterium]|nr:MoaD/ThiS family protein [Nocardioidaceae bacterium]